MWWTWLVISIITKNKPHAHHKIYLNTMKIYNTWPVSLTIEVLHKDSSFFRPLKYALVPSRAQEARALKRAGSSNLAVMQESGYYQSDKTRWQTLYWTIRDIIQRKLVIISWHSFAAGNSEGTNYFFSRLFSVLFYFSPANKYLYWIKFHLRDLY